MLLEHFYSWFIIDLVDDVPFRTRHYTLPPYRHQAVADGPTSLCLTREQRVGDPTGDDFIIAVLIGRPDRIEIIAGSPPHSGRNCNVERFSSSSSKKFSSVRVMSPSGKTNRPIASAERWGSRSWATCCPTARASSSSLLAIPLVHCRSSEEMVVTTTEKPDSSASSPFIVPSAEQPVRGTPPVASRTARNRDR